MKPAGRVRGCGNGQRAEQQSVSRSGLAGPGDLEGIKAGQIEKHGMLTHDELWAGVDLKIENAEFHFDAMSRVLQPQSPERVGTYTVVGG